MKKRCPVCGEFRDEARRILCWCDGYVCGSCGVGRMRRPISNYLDAGRVIHIPYLAGWRRCDDCGAAHAWVPASEATAA